MCLIFSAISFLLKSLESSEEEWRDLLSMARQELCLPSLRFLSYVFGVKEVLHHLRAEIL